MVILVSCVAVLFARFASGVALITVALLVIEPVAVGFTTIVTVAAPFGAMEPMEQVIGLLMLQEPWVEFVLTRLTPDGKVSVTTTPSAASGPLLVTLSVYVRSLLIMTGSGRSLMAIAKSARISSLATNESLNPIARSGFGVVGKLEEKAVPVIYAL